MQPRVSLCELVEIAVEIERNGRAFYAENAKNMSTPAIKDVFAYLAGEEEKHISLFQKLANALCAEETASSYADDYYAYINALAGEHVFTKQNSGYVRAQNITKAGEALDIGIAFEKDSILFYETMKPLFPEEERYMIDLLIEEEKGHFKTLREAKDALLNHL